MNTQVRKTFPVVYMVFWFLAAFFSGYTFVFGKDAANTTLLAVFAVGVINASLPLFGTIGKRLVVSFWLLVAALSIGYTVLAVVAGDWTSLKLLAAAFALSVVSLVCYSDWLSEWFLVVIRTNITEE